MLTNEIVVILHFQMQQKPSAFSRDKPCDKIKYTLFFFPSETSFGANAWTNISISCCFRLMWVRAASCSILDCDERSFLQCPIEYHNLQL